MSLKWGEEGGKGGDEFATSAWRKRVSELRKHFALGWGRIAVVLLVLALGWQGSSVQAQIVTVNFYGISPGASAENIATGEEQFWLDVTHHAGETTATFKFYNVGLLPSSITDIYIDDGHLTTLQYLVNGPGVNFAIGASPGHLPDEQHAIPPFVATKQFNMDADPPPFSRGINPGEWLEAVYEIEAGTTVFDIEQEIRDGQLRIGYHVQGFSDGDSGSFVNTPEPASILLLGLGALALLRKRRFC